MPFADQFHRCMNLPNKGDMINTFFVQDTKITQRNLHDGVYDFPIELVVVGESVGGKQGVLQTFKPFFTKIVSLYTQYGSLYQCRCEKLVIENIAPKTYKIATMGIGCRIYPRQELESFMKFLKESTGFTELQSDAIITAYLSYYQKIL